MQGKTLIQKRAYFLDKFLQLGLRFKPHYYGPYSPDLDDAIGRAKVLGFIQENAIDFGPDKNTGFEVRRFDYVLTPVGHVAVEALKKQYSSQWGQLAQTLDRIRKADNNDYVALSLAAKTFYILSTSDVPLGAADIVEEARRIGWEVSQRDIERAVDLLVKLGLITCNATQEAPADKFPYPGNPV